MIAMLLDKTRFHALRWASTQNAHAYFLSLSDFHFLASGQIRSGGASAFRQISLDISKATGKRVLTAYTGPLIEAMQDPASIVLPADLSDNLFELYGLLASDGDDLDTIIGMLRH